MVLSPLRGAVAFLSRLPVRWDDEAWRAFRARPWSFPAVGALLGLPLAAPLALAPAVSRPTAVVAFLFVWVGLLGINHLDGVADLGDAAVVHGDAADRVAVLKDADLGVGGVVALALALLGTTFGALGLTGRSPAALLSAVVAAEVGAKAVMAGVACLGQARHEGLGSQFTERNGRRDLAVAVAVAVGLVAAVALATGALPVAVNAFLGAVFAGGLLATWANRLLDGVNGDVFGAADVAARLGGYHAALVVAALGGPL